MKFRSDSDEECCGKVIPWIKGWDDLGGICCMRTAGHEGKCEATMCDAAAMDGVCHHCRAPIDGPHKESCSRNDP